MKELIATSLNDDNYKTFITHFVKSHKKNERDLFEMSAIVCDFKPEWQFLFVDCLIELKVDIEIFRKLIIFHMPSSWTGSQVCVIDNVLANLNRYLLNEYKFEKDKYYRRLLEIKKWLTVYKDKTKIDELRDNIYD